MNPEFIMKVLNLLSPKDFLKMAAKIIANGEEQQVPEEKLNEVAEALIMHRADMIMKDFLKSSPEAMELNEFLDEQIKLRDTQEEGDNLITKVNRIINKKENND